MVLSVMIIPGRGQKEVEFPGATSATVQQVVDTVRRTIGDDISNREITINGEEVPKASWGTKQCWPGDLVTASAVVKGA